ncbi:MAG: hypothetical protein M3Z54_02725 [Gemmatimonadota bacterium]|nr:hypothetical protein [Gemmatimonadota bacterium]
MSNGKSQGQGHGRDEVTITVNNQAYQIHRGRQSVADIKRLAIVPLADELAQDVNGTLTPLPDAGAVTIVGGERFVSYPKDSASS